MTAEIKILLNYEGSFGFKNLIPKFEINKKISICNNVA